ncbi:S-adenosyl-L-methionine-dependent methyltransferase [Westerdykella ornata]|uniref:S-adenosyl-L-methionine-dependent methyltransferase n=1 Tax=Westerdykella ornata TaxID=318751 RepID=A0A6A6JNY5_WESOR|nr:S-adenosyl-L-methionine-dependent methyltransferase [Westerdykella ornata]KAF2276649.1 S-adenosyl-L-methionine-dependent methyltransferase [Westerdykella ornata]
MADAATAASKTGKNDDNVIFGANQTEVERLDMQHKVVYDAMPQQVQAPIDFSKSGLRILDQATGSGIWIRDLRATSSGSHTWVGTDIEDSYFPSDPPSDTSYHHQSMTEPWPTEWKGTFDLVHSRMALPGVGTNPLEATVKGLVELVKPGGYIQFVEMDWNEWEAGPAGQAFHDAVYDLFTVVSAGQGVDILDKLIPMLKDAGLEDVQYKKFPIPFGKNASDKVREISRKSLYATAMGVSMTTKILPAAALRLSREELDALPDKLAKEIDERGFTMTLFSLWGRKPEN